MFINQILIFFISVILISISISGYGSLLKLDLKKNFFLNLFLGFLIISLIITFIHFFFKINYFLSFLIFFTGILIFLIQVKIQ